MEDIACYYRWPPSEINRMNVDELMRWHAAAARAVEDSRRGL